MGAVFSGERLAIVFGARKGVSFFDLTVDGETVMIEIKEGAERTSFVYPKPLSSGTHRLKLFKRSEADAGFVAIAGIELAANGSLEPVETPKPKLRMQFFGDSITVGACNEDGAADQWENRATHNNALSYAALTAGAFAAGYRNIAVSGMGVVEGYVPKRAGEIWDRLYPEADSPRADEANWSPEVVFVNYGENDDSFSKNQGQSFPADFAARYVALVRAMRIRYANAEIVLLRGGMWGGAKSVPLREAWEKAVRELEADDPHLHPFVFEHWSDLHPRVSDHQAMAGELIAWLRQQPFMKRFE